MKFCNTENRSLQLEGETVWISRSVTVLPVLIFVVGEPKLAHAALPLGKRGEALADEVGKWGLPGGYLDYDETAGEAVVREVWEELGLNLPALQSQYRFVGQLDQPYEVCSEPVRRQNVTLCFPLMFFLPAGAALPTLTPQVGQDEVVEARWVALPEALQMSLAFDHQQVTADCLQRYYQQVGIVLA